jgi:hypothetical protein
MKLFLSCFLFYSTFVVAQNRKIVLIDNDTKKPIELANISFNNSKGTYSDINGCFSVAGTTDSITISFVGYLKKKLSCTAITDTISLSRSNENLNEVSVRNKSQNVQRIFPIKNLNNLLPKNYGTSAPIPSILIKAVYIPNEKKDTTKLISKIIIYPTDYISVYLGAKNRFEKQKNQKYAPYKINMYTVDTLIGIPSKKIFQNDITVQLTDGQNQLIYELTPEQQMNFPLEGIFIAISSFGKEYYEKLGFKSGPAFKNIGISEESKFKMFEKSFAFCETEEECKWFRDQYMWGRKNTYYVGLEIY